MAGRHHENAALFTHASGFAPTIGIIGTVMGLVHVLENLSNPAALGPSIAAAFIATFLGVASANLCYLPVANRLKRLGELEAMRMELVVEGVWAIQSGANPARGRPEADVAAAGSGPTKPVLCSRIKELS